MKTDMMRSIKHLYKFIGVLLLLCCISCEGGFGRMDENPYADDDTHRSELDYDDSKEQEENNQGSSSGSQTTGSLSELKSFDIEFDNGPLTEDETVPSDESDPSYEDYVENYTVKDIVEVVWSGTAATFSGAVDKVSITCEGTDVTITSSEKGMCYVLKGNCPDGMVSIYSDYKFRLDIEGLTLSNADGPAINIQSGKRAYVILSGTNTLTDGPAYATSEEDRKGTFFSEGQLCFSGTGTLNVIANHKNGIVSDDYLFFRRGPVINVTSSGTNGLKANDWIQINGGVLNVEATAAGGKCLSSDGYIRINGGRATLMTTGGLDESDYSSSCCVKSDSIFVMAGGELFCKSTGRGGKGIKADMNAYFNGGTVRVITAGADDTSRPKGIRVEGKLFINGGDIMVRVASHEGIESKSYIEINGGRIMVHSYDDAINSAGELIFNGGYVYSQSTSNDGLDSNGNMTFNDGVIYAVGPSAGAECAIDVNEEGRAYIVMNGGIVVGAGAGNSTPSAGTQSWCVYGNTGMGGGPGGGPGGPGGGPGGFGGGRPGNGGSSSGSISSAATCSVTDADGGLVLAFTSPVAASGLFVSSPALVKGSSYTLSSGVTVNGGNDFCGLITDAEVSGGNKLGTMTASGR